MKKAIKIAGIDILPGESKQLALPVAKLYTDTPVSIPVHVFRGKAEGPTIFVSAAVHGDELNGIEVIRRLLTLPKFKISKGTLIAVPMVNVYGVLNQSRYMPDRRDLNRSFPGSSKGSLAGQLAHTFLNEIVAHCDYGIDLHTGAIHRSNLPQVRADLSDPETLKLAESFGVPVLLNSTLRDGSLRESAVQRGTKILLYEAGQALRFDEVSIQLGLKGVLNVLSLLGMRKKRASKRKINPFVANRSDWVRATGSGFVFDQVKLGAFVNKGEVLADINSSSGERIAKVLATRAGIVIGKQNIPLVQQGDAMFHIAYFGEENQEVADGIELLREEILDDVHQNTPI